MPSGGSIAFSAVSLSRRSSSLAKMPTNIARPPSGSIRKVMPWLFTPSGGPPRSCMSDCTCWAAERRPSAVPPSKVTTRASATGAPLDRVLGRTLTERLGSLHDLPDDAFLAGRDRRAVPGHARRRSSQRRAAGRPALSRGGPDGRRLPDLGPVGLEGQRGPLPGRDADARDAGAGRLRGAAGRAGGGGREPTDALGRGRRSRRWGGAGR